MRKNLRRISLLVTAQTAGNIQRLAAMERTVPGRVVDKLVRDRMILLRKYRRDGAVKTGECSVSSIQTV